ncbi:hypothetical protein WM40_17350 [Robbsia andropogonis]|uniref:Uncharacterized protein n=2 Tax=Robbsia andropogonis TaxID=28092 RepID=A0A0F5JXH6_9BURK|nr:hypothetical protein WM40_17350 [Robbsia andropogonis]
MQKPRPSQCVVVFWNDDEQSFVSYSLDASRVKPLVENALPLEVHVEDFGGVIDDEFARKLGGANIKVLAATNPAIKPLDQITTHPDA